MWPLVVELGDPVGLRVVDRGEQDQRVRLVGAEGGDEAAQAVAQEVVAEVHDEGRVADEVGRGEDRVGEAGGLVLDDVGDLGTELGAVAGRLADLVAGLGRDDDPDLLHPGVDQRLDPVKEHGFVGDGHELLRRGVGDRAQPGSGAAREDESLQRLHARPEPTGPAGQGSGPVTIFALARLPTILALMLATLTSSLSWAPSLAPAAKPKPPKQPLPRTAVIVLENHEYSQVIGNSGEMPFLNRLVSRGALATNYNGVSHPSLPNYLALIGGSTYGIDSDCTSCWASGTNLGVQLSEAGVSWRAYMEDMPEPCYSGATYGGYAKKHNPFMYFESITAVPGLCRNVVPANARLEADLGSREGLRTFTWLTPNLCNDGHDCGLATVDSWLSTWAPRITRKLGPEGVLVITFDEGYGAGLHIPTLFVGPGARKGIQLTGPFNHYSLLATIESRYHLPRLNEAAAALPMRGAILKPRKRAIAHDRRRLNSGPLDQGRCRNGCRRWACSRAPGSPATNAVWTFLLNRFTGAY